MVTPPVRLSWGEPIEITEALITQLVDILAQARKHTSRGDAAAAEPFWRQLTASDSANKEALEQLVMICLQQGRPDEAVELLQQLVAHYPDETLYCDRLATLFEARGRRADAIECYRRHLDAHPERNNTRYNLAKLLKRHGDMLEALQQYRYCLERNIQQPEEVLSNISIILSGLQRHDEAKQALEEALGHKADYLPALFNLGLLHEEQANWPAALELFQNILTKHSLHPGALSHIAQGSRTTNASDPVVIALQQALKQKAATPLEREELLYALGKTHDDCGRYDQAFDYYQQANSHSRQRCGNYSRQDHENLIDQIIARCNKPWLASIEPVSELPLVFICGMFRSGTTVLEQIVAAHPALTAGGEIDYFQRSMGLFPAAILTATPGDIAAIGRGYLDHLAQHFPVGARVINKRPDNFLALGVLQALFPNARIITTQRQALDNCLSLFFQPLESGQAYANDLLDAAHYYLQQQRLMQHWQHILAKDSLLEVPYQALVNKPRETVEEVLEFLQVEWNEACLSFHTSENRVRTASVHQVRQPLHSNSDGRWNNYHTQLVSLREYLGKQATVDQMST